MPALSRKMALAAFALTAVAMLQPLAWRAAGIKPQDLENRPMSSRPKITVDRLLDSTLYESISRYLEDRNPLRWYAVVAQARFRYEVFGTVENYGSSSQVVAGRDGWLFITDSLNQPCWDVEELKRGVSVLRSMQDALSERGKTFVFTVAPNKASIYPEKLAPALVAMSACARQSRDGLDGFIRTSGLTHYIDAFDALQSARKTEQRPLYVPKETHWTDLGSIYFVSQLMRQVFGETRDLTRLRATGSSSPTPDLSRLSGLFIPHTLEHYVHDLGGVVTRQPTTVEHGGEGRPYVRQTSTSNSVPLDHRKVLILHDSFFYISWDHLASFFDDVLYVHWNAFDPAKFGEFARSADIIIVESVEREVYKRLSELKPEQAQAFRDALGRADVAR